MIVLWLFIENTIKRNSWQAITCKFLKWHLWENLIRIHEQKLLPPSSGGHQGYRELIQPSRPGFTVPSYRLTLVPISYPNIVPQNINFIFLNIPRIFVSGFRNEWSIKALVNFFWYIDLILAINWSLHDHPQLPHFFPRSPWLSVSFPSLPPATSLLIPP